MEAAQATCEEAEADKGGAEKSNEKEGNGASEANAKARLINILLGQLSVHNGFLHRADLSFVLGHFFLSEGSACSFWYCDQEAFGQGSRLFGMRAEFFVRSS